MIYTNRSAKRVFLIVEPWAEKYWIESGVMIEIVDISGMASRDDFIETESVEGGLIVYGWSGCVLSVLQNGVLLEPDFQA